MKKAILFGNGKIGKMALDLFKKDNIAFFVDNNIIKGQEKIFQGIKVISFEDFKVIRQNYIIVLTVSPKYEFQIAKQLWENGILYFYLWEEVIGLFNFDKQTEAVKIREKIGGKYDEHFEKIQTIKEMVNLKQDENSQVEFYLVDSFEISHFLPIYTALKKEGVRVRIVAEPSAINSAEDWFNYHDAIDELSVNGVEYSTLRNPKADLAFTTQFARNLKYYIGRKCQMSYGVVLMREKAFQLKKDVAEQFDYLFVNGNIYKEIITSYFPEKHVIDMSYPKYLKDFGEELTREEVINELKINTTRPIVVYYPTWDECSSIQKYENAIKKLREKYFFIVKPHHCTYRFADAMKSLYRSCDLVLDSRYDLFKAASITDCALCDAKSGVVTELVFLKPEIRMLLIYQNCSSSDFYIDLNKFAEGIKSPIELGYALKNVFNNDEKIKLRKDMIYKMYSSDIKAGIKRIVEMVHKVLRSN